MKVVAEKGFAISIIGYVLLHFFTYFFEVKSLIYVLSLTGLSAVFFSILLFSSQHSKIPFFLISVAFLILFFQSGSAWNGIVEGLREMRNLVGLLLVVPMISWVLKEEPYIEEMLCYAHRMLNTSRKFYFGLIGMTQIISYFLFFGSVAMMYQIINTFLTDHTSEAWENYKGTAILRGFALSTLWVVSVPSFIFAVEALDIPLWKAVSQGFVFSVAGIIFAGFLSYLQEKKYGVNFTKLLTVEIERMMETSRNVGKWNKDVIEFILTCISLFGSILLFNAITEFELLLTIPIVIFGWTILYYSFKRRTRRFVVKAKRYIRYGIVEQFQQYFIILSAGLLIFALNKSGVAEKFVNGLHLFTETIPAMNFLFVLPLLVVMLGFAGIGPLPANALVAGVVGSMQLPYPPELLLLAITSGSVISILLSPIIIPVIMLSNNNGLTPLKNGIQFNWKFAILFFCLIQMYLQVMVF